MGKNFTFSEPLALQARYLTGFHNNFLPQIIGDATLSKLRIKNDNRNFDQAEWGISGGIAFEGPYERLSYIYNSGCGGYHTLELFLVGDYKADRKTGTIYSFSFGEDIWMLRVSFYTDKFTPDPAHSANTGIHPRPWRHYALAAVGALPPLLPLMLLFPGGFN